MKPCDDCSHQYRDKDAIPRCNSEIANDTAINNRCHLMRLPEWPCGPDGKYFKGKWTA